MAKRSATKKKANADRPLSDRERLFVAEYLKDLNGSAAAIRAGYSAKASRQIASRLLTKANIQDEIAKGNQARLARATMDAQGLLERLIAEMNADIADLYDDEDRLKPVKEWPMIFRTGLVAGIETEELYEGTGDDRVKTGEVRKLKMSERAKRMEMFGRHASIGAFKNKVEHTVEEPLKKLFDQIAGNAIRPGGGGAPR